jgi:hypothetical protein
VAGVLRASSAGLGEPKSTPCSSRVGPNTVGRDEDAIRAYIRNQEKEDQRLEQMNLALIMPPSGGPQLKGSRQRPSYRFERFTI